MRRISLRLRLTLAFALAMTLVLTVMGFIVYQRLGTALLSTVDQTLAHQADEAVRRAGGDGPLVDPDAGEGGTLAQFVDASGRVVRSTPAGSKPLTGASTLERARSRRTVVRVESLPGRTGEWRLLAEPVRVDGRPLTLVVARSVGPREEALRHLLTDFLIAGPLLVLLASLAGYGLAAAALRPVEARRRKAVETSASNPSRQT
ncbi:MAG: two-component sensor histidine kinase, partial [Gaiellaceae bacterium]